MIDPGAMLAGLGAMAAGVGIYRFGASRGAMQSKALQAFEIFIATQARIADAQDRQAKALEESAKLLPLLETLSEQREQMSLTMRVMSRELRELRGLVANGRKEPAEE